MGATVDDKVVAMSFDSKKFESGVSDTVSALDKLKKALHFPEAGKGLEDISKAASRVNLSHIADDIEKVKQNLQAMKLVAIGVLSRIAYEAVATGSRMIKALTLAPLKDGLREYETQINAVQVILGNTSAAGVKLKDVNKALDELNTYADKTIYNFGQMTRNVGTFTAAGVDLKTSVASIKGIANMAALSGSNAEQASTAMYQLSQAISSGKVQLQDWKSVENASMGSATFKRALAQTAVHMGTLKDNAVAMIGPMKNIKIHGQSFRDSIRSKPGEDSWLTSDVLTTTLKQLSGDMTDAQLVAAGYTKAQVKDIQAMANTALKAATTVKTFTQLVDTTKEQLGTGWASTFEILLGDFGEAKTLFTGISNAIGEFTTTMANSRNSVLKDWKALGGRKLLIDSIRIAFHNLMAIIKPIKQAFRDIFPAKTGKDLFEFTKSFSELAKRLKPSERTIVNLRNTFQGIFAALDIGKQIIFGVIGMFRKLIGATGAGSGGFLDFSGNLGEWVFQLDKALKKGQKITHFFDALGGFLAKPIKLLRTFAHVVGNLFSEFAPGGFSDKMKGMTKSMSPFARVIDAIQVGWGKFVDKFQGSDTVLERIFDSIVKGIKGFAETLAKGVSGINFEAVLQVIRTGLFAGIFLMLKKFLGKGSLTEQLAKSGGGFIKNISGSMEALKGSMVAMQTQIKANTLKTIAISIALLAGSVTALSLVDPKKLTGAIGAMTVAFGELLGSMKILTVVSGTKGFLAIPAIAAGLILLGGAIDTITVAVVAMSLLSWESLIKGLGGVGALLLGLTKAVVPLSKNGPGLISAGAGITAIGIGLVFLSHAVKTMGALDLKSLVKGLAGVGATLVLLVGTMEEFPAANMIAIGTGLVGIGIGMRILASAIEKLGSLDLKTMIKGLAGIGGALFLIAESMQAFPEGMVVMAAGLLIVSFSLGKIAKAVMLMSSMSWKEIARGLAALGGSLVILAGALILMEGTVGGAVALGVTALALKVLASALKKLGGMSWKEIGKGLAVVAVAIGGLAAAGVLLYEAIPAMLGLGVAMLALGGGIALLGAGVALIGVGLGAIAASGSAAIGVLIQALIDLTEATPEMAKNIILGLLEIVEQLAKVAPKFVDALAKIINSLVDLVIREAPKIAIAFIAVIDAILKVINERTDEIIAAGIALLISLLQGIKKNINQVTVLVVDIITRFLNTLTANINRITLAGANLLVSLLKGITSQIGKVVSAGIDLIIKFAQAIVGGYGKIISAAVGIVTKFLGVISGAFNRIIGAGAQMILKFVEGLGKNVIEIIKAAAKVAGKFVSALASESLKLARQGAIAIVKFLNGVADIIKEYEPQIIQAFAKIGLYIILGVIEGIKDSAWMVVKELKHQAGEWIKAPLKVIGANSPSKEFAKIGGYMIAGLVNGVNATSKDATKSLENLGYGLIDAIESVFQITSPSKVMHEIGMFVGQGFAQGIRGSSEDIKSAYSELNQKLMGVIHSTQEVILSERSKLTKLLQADKPDFEAIKKSQAIIAQNEILLKKSAAVHATLITTLSAEKTQLFGLAKEYERVGEKLKLAQQALLDAKKARDDAVKGFSDQYSTLPDIVTTDAEGNAVDQLATYMNALKNQADAVAAYQSTLDQLRALGLDDATYKKLLEEGTADQAFATQLLAGGKTAVDGLNKLDAQLKKNADVLAQHAGSNLYQAGVDAAQGLVDGLKSKKLAISRAMADVAELMLAVIKKKLGITSPSKMFAEVGHYSMEGMAQGFSDSSKILTSAVEGAADDALTAMQRSMTNISNVVAENFDANPTITPILDLTQVRSQTGELASLTDVSPITAAASYRQASVISAQQTVESTEAPDVAVGGTHVQFVQTNNSPVALSEIEIYRQTKNQLAKFQSAFVGGP